MRKLKTGIKAWKVVTEDRESVLQLFFNVKWGRNSKIIPALKKKKFLKVYKEGKIVSAGKNFPPILCFESRITAKVWINMRSELHSAQIIEVIGYKREEIKVMHFDHDVWTHFLETFKINTKKLFLPVNGSIGFRKVKVLT